MNGTKKETTPAAKGNANIESHRVRIVLIEVHHGTHRDAMWARVLCGVHRNTLQDAQGGDLEEDGALFHVQESNCRIRINEIYF